MTDRSSTGEIRPSAPVVVTFAAVRADVGLARIVANTAAALSDVDLNVLVIDAASDGELVRDYFEPFLMGTTEALDDLSAEEGRFVSALADGRLVLFRHASPVGRGKLNVLGPFRPFSALSADRPEFAPGAEVRAILRRQPYDVVLIGLQVENQQQARLVGDLSDRVAVCFAPGADRVREAVDMAKSILDMSIRRPPMIAVATPFDARAAARGDQAISDIRQAFGRLGTSVAERVAQVPEQGLPQGLGLLLEDPAARPRSVGTLKAYGDLAWFITDGRIQRLSPAPLPVRDRHRRSLAPRPDGRGEMRALVAYEFRDRPWADWVSEQLRQAGFTVGFWRSDQSWLDEPIPGTLVVLGSTAFSESTVAAEVVEFLRRITRTSYDAVLAQLDHGRGDIYPATRPIDLTSSTESEAQRHLLAGLGQAARILDGDGREPRHRFPRVAPAEQSPTYSVPRRTNELVGRNGYLERIRDALLLSEGVGLVVLAGDAGVGKSAIAQEYAIRFAYDYDVVWWIPAGDQQDVRASLARLGFAVGVEPSDDMVDATLSALRSAQPGRTLLIYDAAADLEALTRLVPLVGLGHVVVTATPDAMQTATDVPVHRLPVGPLTDAEAVAVLRRYTPALPAGAARRLTDVTSRLPLSLHLAGALVRHLAGRIEVEQGRTPSEAADRSAAQLADDLAPRGSVAAILHFTLNELAGGDRWGRLTRRLAELCCFMDHNRVGLELLRWPSMVEQLAEAAGEADSRALLDEPYDVDQVIWLGQRLEIFSVFWGADSELRLHGLVRSVVFDSMTDGEREQRRLQAARGLAGFLAGRPQEGPVLAELRPHLGPAGALTSTEWPVRRWVVAQLRWISDDDDAVALRRTLEMTESAYASWTEHDEPTESLILQLATWRADLQRTIGLTEQSLKHDQDLLAPATEKFGLRSVRALTIRRGMSGDLRGVGDFDRARGLDQRTWRRFRDLFGDDHRQTLTAAHNLATSYFLAGNPERALAQEVDTLRRRIALFGLDEPFTWWSMADTAAYHRELGRYATAARQLYAALDRVRKSRPANHPDVLRIKGHLAIAERRQGRFAVARQLNFDALNGYQHALGPEHPRTRASRLSLAIDHFRLDEFQDAHVLAVRSLEDYSSHLPDQHPFTEISRMNLALIEWGMGERDAAREHATHAVEVLTARLDDVHPWVLAARLNAAGMTAAPGAEVLDILGLCREFLGTEHPYTMIATAAARGGENTAPAPIDVDVPEV